MRKYFYWCSWNFKKGRYDQTKLHFKLPGPAENLSNLVNLVNKCKLLCPTSWLPLILTIIQEPTVQTSRTIPRDICTYFLRFLYNNDY